MADSRSHPNSPALGGKQSTQVAAAPVVKPVQQGVPQTARGIHAASGHATDTTFRPDPVGGTARPPH